MPVKIIIRENGKQCMMQMPVKTTLRLYCDDSRLVFKCIQRHQCIATQLPCYYSFVHKNVIVKLREICMETGSTSSATKVIARYTRERGSPEANSGLSTSNLLLSYLLLWPIGGLVREGHSPVIPLMDLCPSRTNPSICIYQTLNQTHSARLPQRQT